MRQGRSRIEVQYLDAFKLAVALILAGWLLTVWTVQPEHAGTANPGQSVVVDAEPVSVVQPVEAPQLPVAPDPAPGRSDGTAARRGL